MKNFVSAFNGVLRPLVTLLFCAGFLYGFQQDKIAAEVFVSVVSLVIGFYFVKREQDKKEDADAKAEDNEVRIGNIEKAVSIPSPAVATASGVLPTPVEYNYERIVERIDRLEGELHKLIDLVAGVTSPVNQLDPVNKVEVDSAELIHKADPTIAQ